MKKLIVLAALTLTSQVFAATEVQKIVCSHEQGNFSFEIGHSMFGGPQMIKVKVAELKKETLLSANELSVTSEKLDEPSVQRFHAKGTTLKTRLVGGEKVDGEFILRVTKSPGANTATASIFLSQVSKNVFLNLNGISCTVTGLSKD